MGSTDMDVTGLAKSDVREQTQLDCSTDCGVLNESFLRVPRDEKERIGKCFATISRAPQPSRSLRGENLPELLCLLRRCHTVPDVHPPDCDCMDCTIEVIEVRDFAFDPNEKAG